MNAFWLWGCDEPEETPKLGVTEVFPIIWLGCLIMCLVCRAASGLKRLNKKVQEAYLQNLTAVEGIVTDQVSDGTVNETDQILPGRDPVLPVAGEPVPIELKLLRLWLQLQMWQTNCRIRWIHFNEQRKRVFFPPPVVSLNDLLELGKKNQDELCRIEARISGYKSNDDSKPQVETPETDDHPSLLTMLNLVQVPPKTPTITPSSRPRPSGSKTASSQSLNRKQAIAELRRYYAKKRLDEADSVAATADTHGPIRRLDSESNLLGSDFEMVPETIDPLEIVQIEDCTSAINITEANPLVNVDEDNRQHLFQF